VDIQGSSPYQILFEGVRGTSYKGDIAVDDVSFSDGCALVQCKLSNTFLC